MRRMKSKYIDDLKERSCTSKKLYKTESLATINALAHGKEFYKCRYCEGYHLAKRKK